MIDTLLPVGKDCDCGHPLVWRGSAQLCAVYGRHPIDGERVFFRTLNARGASLIANVMRATHNPPPRSERRLRAVS